MTPEEARSQLDACTLRPGDADAEARALAMSDAELKSWLEKRAAEDERCATSFMEAPLPAGLSDRLVAAMHAEAPARAKPTVFRTVVPWLAVATAAAIVLIATVDSWRDVPAKATWQDEVLAFVSQIETGGLPLDHFSDNLEMLKEGLKVAHAPSPGTLPKSLAGLPSLGCKVIHVAGRPASIICFKMAPGKEAHLVIIDNAGLKQVPPQHKPQFDQHGAWRVASWSDGAHSYLLATHAEEKDLRRLFSFVLPMPRQPWPT
jgi:hypothetical protein